MKMNKSPKTLLIFKILGFLALATAIYGAYLSITGFGDFTTHNFMIGGILSCFGFFCAFVFLGLGFYPEMTRFSTKLAKHVQEENREDLRDIATGVAEISADAVEITAEAVKRGLSDTVYCKKCGEKIDADSVFCKNCGEKQ